MYVKQPQNILSNHKILKIKMKEHEIEKKKNTGKKLNEIYIVLILSDILVQLYLHQEKLFS